MAIPINAASAIVTDGKKQRPEEELPRTGADEFERRVAAHAERLWREAGQKGSVADYREKARTIAAREDIPQEAQSTG
ncbi:hypothetical protein [Desertibaculum subflavum]|uniref:hypothetical protein n=1 Tax=Desertibaculum subflavum TaxID=2268458 RepID=UPI000E663CE6